MLDSVERDAFTRNNRSVNITYIVKSLSCPKYSLIHNDVDWFYLYICEGRYLMFLFPLRRELKSVLSTGVHDKCVECKYLSPSSLDVRKENAKLFFLAPSCYHCLGIYLEQGKHS